MQCKSESMHQQPQGTTRQQWCSTISTLNPEPRIVGEVSLQVLDTGRDQSNRLQATASCCAAYRSRPTAAANHFTALLPCCHLSIYLLLLLGAMLPIGMAAVARLFLQLQLQRLLLLCC